MELMTHFVTKGALLGVVLIFASRCSTALNAPRVYYSLSFCLFCSRHSRCYYLRIGGGKKENVCDREIREFNSVSSKLRLSA